MGSAASPVSLPGSEREDTLPDAWDHAVRASSFGDDMFYKFKNWCKYTCQKRFVDVFSGLFRGNLMSKEKASERELSFFTERETVFAAAVLVALLVAMNLVPHVINWILGPR
jgi:hypothetical protein